ncbi:TMEM9 [Cinara cedri]|uniref:TMEM9 n=1 Tax=Cinara cedri TaxID=506608 RepID=A0A5E4N9A8_9HEMI|nr:TMEM9 [Cinara cedri]
MFILPIFVGVLLSTSLSKGESYEDARCKCVCTIVNGTEMYNKLYIANVLPSNDCNGVSLPVIGEVNNTKKELCPRCTCTYESRNTTTMKVVVLIVLCVISILVTYMLFLLCLEPMIRKRKLVGTYVEHTNEEDDLPHAVSLDTRGGSDPMISVASNSNVLNRFGHQQNKWKKQVKEQRKNIYDRHTILN